VKLFEQDGELYVLAKREGRKAKETAMRRSLPSLVQLLMRLGAAKAQAGRAFQFVHLQVPKEGQVTRETFQFSIITCTSVTAARAVLSMPHSRFLPLFLCPTSLRQTCNSRKSVKPGIKAQNSLDSMVPHDRQVHCITRRETLVGKDNLFGALDSGPVNREDFIHRV
jgi:hypothetical protein